MANAHDRIVDAVVLALTADPALAQGHVAEDVDYDSLPEGVEQSIVVVFVGSTPEGGAIKGAPVDWLTSVQLRCQARRDSALTGARASRVLHAQAYARLMADPSLGGLAFDIDPPQIQSDMQRVDTRVGCIDALYVIRHRTQEHTLEV